MVCTLDDHLMSTHAGELRPTHIPESLESLIFFDAPISPLGVVVAMVER